MIPWLAASTDNLSSDLSSWQGKFPRQLLQVRGVARQKESRGTSG